MAQFNQESELEHTDPERKRRILAELGVASSGETGWNMHPEGAHASPEAEDIGVSRMNLSHDASHLGGPEDEHYRYNRKPLYADPSMADIEANEALANESIDRDGLARKAAMERMMADTGTDMYDGDHAMSNLFSMPRKRPKSSGGGGGGMGGMMGGGGGGMNIGSLMGMMGG